MNEAGDPNGGHWLHLGGESISLDELGFTPESQPWHATGLADVTILTTGAFTKDIATWVTTHPVAD